MLSRARAPDERYYENLIEVLIKHCCIWRAHRSRHYKARLKNVADIITGYNATSLADWKLTFNYYELQFDFVKHNSKTNLMFRSPLCKIESLFLGFTKGMTSSIRNLNIGYSFTCNGLERGS